MTSSELPTGVLERMFRLAVPDGLRADEITVLDARLQATFDSDEAICAWLLSGSRYLRGQSPADALRAGDIQRVHMALEAIDSGIFL